MTTPTLVDKYGLDPGDVADELASLPLRVCGRSAYESHIPMARDQIGARDPKDVALLALALALEIPVWSQDRDFDTAKVTRFTTGQLLSMRGQ